MKNIPIFIISFNRLSCLRDLVAWLLGTGHTNIHIVDNGSSYPPLLSWLQAIQSDKVKVHYMDKNWGFYVVAESKIFDDIWKNNYYVLTDPDVVPSPECPDNLLEVMHGVLQRHPEITKVGLGLRLDDIPNHYLLKVGVLEWEKKHWESPIQDEVPLFKAAVDTTFALCRPGVTPAWQGDAARTGSPYWGQHRTWYLNLSQLNEEDEYYKRTTQGRQSHWISRGQS